MYQVLLVDDEPILQMGIRKMLENAQNYTICATARNGAEALQYLQDNPVDIIMTDLKMPVMDGVSLIKVLQQRKYPAPIMVLSNYSEFVLVREALTSGAKDYILKLDLTESSLLEHLDKLAEHIQSARATQAPSAPQAQQEELRSQLRSFFREPQTSENPYPLPQPLQPPFLAFTVYFPKGSIKSDRLRRVWPHVETVLQTAFAGTYLLPLLLHHNELLCLVSFQEEPLTIANSLQRLQRQLATYFSVTPTICYCLHLDTLEKAKHAYERCREAYDLSFYDGEKTFFSVRDIHVTQTVPPEDITQLVGKMLDTLHTGQVDQAISQAREVFSQWQRQCLAPERARLSCLRILDAIRYSIEVSELPPEYNAEQEAIENATTMDAMQTHFASAIRLLTEYNGRPFEAHKREVQEVLRYLHTHYTENITLETLSETTCLNRSYLCRVFKKEMGMSIFSYLNTVRMKHAEELLKKEGDMYIKEIAQRVGIADPFYFTRRFKEYSGVSPKEFLDRINAK